MNKTLILKEIQKWEALERLEQNKDYLEYLKPILEAQLSNKWLDPSQFKSLKEFHKAYSEMWGKAKAFEEIVLMLSNAGEMARNLSKQKDEKPKNYAI